MLLDTLDANLLGNMLAGKGITRAGYGSIGKGTIKESYGSKLYFFIPPYRLTNFEIQEYYQKIQ